MESETINMNSEQANNSMDDEVREIREEEMINARIPSQPTDSVSCSQKRPRSQTAKCWDYFTRIVEDGKEKASCNFCKKVYAVGGRTHGTSNLNKHIEVCPLRSFKDVGQMIIDGEGKMRSKRINLTVMREKQAIAIIKHNWPFSIVEQEGFRDLLMYLNPDVKFISRNTAKSDVVKIYDREKVRLKENLAKIPGKICLTADLWTACTSEGYLCVTGHYVDNDWNLNCKLLSFCHMPPPHSGVELTQKILSLLKEWEIEDKIFSITLDNASANDNMQERLMNALKLQYSLLCNGEFFHIRCCAHILNLIVQDGLRVLSDALHKIRETVKYVRGSESRMRTFADCVKLAKLDDSCGLRLDMVVRWNSTYLMLESALRYRAAFSHLEVRDTNYKYGLSEMEWTRVHKIREFLQPFYKITSLFSGSSYPTSNLYFMNVWQIQCLLLKYMKSEDHLLRSMAIRMMEKFEKYWEEYSLVLSFGVVFDPRCKIDALEYCFSKIDSNTCQEKVNIVKNKLNQLFNEYQNKVGEKDKLVCGSSSSIRAYGTQYDIDQMGNEFFDDFELFKDAIAQKKWKERIGLVFGGART